MLLKQHPREQLADNPMSPYRSVPTGCPTAEGPLGLKAGALLEHFLRVDELPFRKVITRSRQFHLKALIFP